MQKAMPKASIFLAVLLIASAQAAEVTSKYHPEENHYFLSTAIGSHTPEPFPLPTSRESSFLEITTYTPSYNETITDAFITYDDSKKRLSFNETITPMGGVLDITIKKTTTWIKKKIGSDPPFWEASPSPILETIKYNSFILKRTAVLTPIPETNAAIMALAGFLMVAVARRKRSQ